MRIVFPWDLRHDLRPAPPPHQVGAPGGGDPVARRRRPGPAGPGEEWRQILERRLKWRMVHEESRDDSQITVWGVIRPEYVAHQVREALPRA